MCQSCAIGNSLGQLPMSLCIHGHASLMVPRARNGAATSQSVKDGTIGHLSAVAPRGKVIQHALELSEVGHLAADVGDVRLSHRLHLGAGQAVSAYQSEQIANLIVT